MAITRALMKRQMYNMGGPTLQAGAPDLRLTGDQTHRGTYTQRRRNQMAGGGIASLNMPRKHYLFGKFGDWVGDVKDKFVDDIIPNELKNPAGAAAAAVAANYLPKLWGGETLLSRVPLPESVKGVIEAGRNILIGDPDNPESKGVIGSVLNIPGVLTSGQYDWGDVLSGIPGAIGKVVGLGDDQYGKYTIPLGIGTAMGKLQQDYLDRQPKFPADQTSINFQTAAEAMADPNLRFKPQAQYANVAEGGRIGYDTGKEVIDYNKDPEYRGWRKMYELNKDAAAINPKHDEYKKFYDTQGQAQGGRIEAQEGGLMNLGGMEKDYRNEGGFVPIGGEEKADDVPARLSKNEFVFTADAVRSAGGGDIDEGAAVMERLMENLEAGGKVSEESQGLEGAREMFANAQQLEKRII